MSTASRSRRTAGGRWPAGRPPLGEGDHAGVIEEDGRWWGGNRQLLRWPARRDPVRRGRGPFPAGRWDRAFPDRSRPAPADPGDRTSSPSDGCGAGTPGCRSSVGRARAPLWTILVFDGGSGSRPSSIRRTRDRGRCPSTSGSRAARRSARRSARCWTRSTTRWNSLRDAPLRRADHSW